jgi:hypothetical protein
MKRFIIALLFAASALSAQQRFAVSEVGEQQLKYYFGMTTRDAEEVSVRRFTSAVLGMNTDRMYLDPETGKRSGTIIIESKLEPVTFAKKILKLQLSFYLDTLRTIEVTLFDAKRCESPQDRTCLRDTTSDYKLIGYILSLIDTARSIAIASQSQANIFHITRMNRFTKIEVCDDDGRWHDLMRVDKRFFARILTKRDNNTKGNIQEMLIDDALEEQGIITCSCGQPQDTRDWGAK